MVKYTFDVPTPEEEATLPLFDMSTLPTEEAVRHLIDKDGEDESRARFMVAMARGEITGDVLAEGDPPRAAEEHTPA